MPTSLFQYEMLPTTWFYLSSLMIIATFFRFNRFWSIRNLDILCLIMFTPGLLYISMGNDYGGYIWLYVVGIFLFFRLLFDVLMIRRPLLEPNLTLSGVIFSCVMLVAFFIPNLIINRGDLIETPRTLRLDQLLEIQQENAQRNGEQAPFFQTPGYSPFYAFSDKIERLFLPSEKIKQAFLEDKSFQKKKNFNRSPQENKDNNSNAPFIEGNLSEKFGENLELAFLDSNVQEDSLTLASPEQEENNEVILQEEAEVQSFNERYLRQESQEKEQKQIKLIDEIFLISFAILAQMGVVLGLTIVGHCHFGNLKTGLAAVMVYLLLPYVNQMPGSLDNVVPGMLIVLAVALYRRPIFSGFLIGLAGSLAFYPFFLLPLWISFYLKRGVYRFNIGVVSSVILMALLLLFSPPQFGTYAEQLARMFGWHSMFVPHPDGLWTFISTYYRIPIITLFTVISFGLVIWPTQKNLATLISCSAMLMLGVQFWMGNSGGLYMGWYLPLLILTLFRPNLEDRVAATTVIEI